MLQKNKQNKSKNNKKKKIRSEKPPLITERPPQAKLRNATNPEPIHLSNK